MRKERIRGIILAVIALILTVLIGCTSAETEHSESADSGLKELPTVTITPKYRETKEKQIDFDLRHLSIVGKDEPEDAEADQPDSELVGEHGAGSEVDDADPVVYEEGADGSDDDLGEDSDISGEYGLQTAVSDGYDYDTESSYTDETESEGSVDEYAGDAEDGYSDGYSDVSEVGEPDLTYLGSFAATAYCSCSQCCGAYSSGYTASGTLATEGRTIACNTLPFGTQVYIEEYGYYIVEDTGWSPYGEAWLDIFFESHDSALAFGLRTVEVYLVN